MISAMENPKESGRPNAAAASRAAVAAVAVVLVIGTIAAYWGLWNNGFINYDDNQYVTENRYVINGLTWQGVVWAFTCEHSYNWHPMTWLSHMMDVQLFGLDPAGHHVINLLLHTINVLLLFGLLRYMTGSLWRSALVAGLFAVHPLHVESVAWVAERKDVLSTLFWLLTVWLYVRYARRPGTVRYVWVVVLFALGLMAKPMLVSLPAVLLLLDYWPLGRFQWKAPVVRHLLLEKLPLAAMSLASAAITLHAQRNAIVPTDLLALPIRLENAVASYARYLLDMFWPGGLAVFYAIPIDGLALIAVISCLVVVAVTWFALRTGRVRGYVLVGWLWYLITLLPVLGIVQVGTQSHADRYTYVPLIGIFIALVWGVSDMVAHRPALRMVSSLAAVVILSTCAVLTNRMAHNWHDDVTLFGHAVDVGQRNYVTLGNLGVALGNRGQVDRGMSYLKETHELFPADVKVLVAMGSITENSGRLAEAMEYYRKALELDPGIKEAQVGMASILVHSGRSQEALPYCRRAIELDPDLALAHNIMGMALSDVGEWDQSLRAFEKVLELRPNMAVACRNMAVVYGKKGDRAGVVRSYERLVAINPDYGAWLSLSRAQFEADDLQDARHSCERAIELDSAKAAAYVGLASIDEKLGNTSGAVAAARKAMTVEPNSAEARQIYERLTK